VKKVKLVKELEEKQYNVVLNGTLSIFVGRKGKIGKGYKVFMTRDRNVIIAVAEDLKIDRELIERFVKDLASLQ